MSRWVSYGVIRKVDDSVAKKIGDLLLSYDGPERDRVRSAISRLGDDDPQRVAHLVDRARQDFRDILFWLELREAEDQQAKLLSGMTVNERLWHLNLMDKWDRAIAARDEPAVVEILRQCHLSTERDYVARLMGIRQ